MFKHDRKTVMTNSQYQNKQLFYILYIDFEAVCTSIYLINFIYFFGTLFWNSVHMHAHTIYKHVYKTK